MASIPLSTLQRKHHLIRDALGGMLGSWKRVEMVLTALQMQAYYGRPCFASARFLAGSALCSEKTWDRALARLRAHGLALVRHRRRRSGYRSTNSVDLTPLWQRLVRLLQQALFKASLTREILRGRWGCRIKVAVGDQRRRRTREVEVFRLAAGP